MKLGGAGVGVCCLLPTSEEGIAFILEGHQALDVVQGGLQAWAVEGAGGEGRVLKGQREGQGGRKTMGEQLWGKCCG